MVNNVEVDKNFNKYIEMLEEDGFLPVDEYKKTDSQGIVYQRETKVNSKFIFHISIYMGFSENEARLSRVSFYPEASKAPNSLCFFASCWFNKTEYFLRNFFLHKNNIAEKLVLSNFSSLTALHFYQENLINEGLCYVARTYSASYGFSIKDGEDIRFFTKLPKNDSISQGWDKYKVPII